MGGKKDKQQQVKLAKEFFDKGTELWYAYEYDEALQEMIKALVIRESILGKHHFHTAKTYFSMGCAYHANAKYSPALICLRRTLRIHFYNMNHHTSASASNIGTSASNANNANNASNTTDQQRLIQSTQDYIKWCFKKQNGDLTSDQECEQYVTKLISAVLNEQQGDELMMAATTTAQAQHDGALQAYNLALQEETTAVGTRHVDIADLYVKIANVMLLMLKNDNDNDSTDAADNAALRIIQNYNRQAVAIYTEAFGKDHPYTQTTLEQMDPAAANNSTKPRQLQSSPLSSKQQQQQQGNKNGSSMLQQLLHKGVSMQDLLESDKHAHLVDKAVKHFHRDRTEFRKNRDDRSSSSSSSSNNHQTQVYYDTDGRYFWMALGCYRHQEYAEALVAFRRTWRIRDQIYGRDHGKTQHVLEYMTSVLVLQATATAAKHKNPRTKSYHQKLFQAVDSETSGDTLMLMQGGGDGATTTTTTTTGQQQQQQVIPALREYQRAAALEASAVGTHHLEYAALQGKIGDCLQLIQQKQASDGDDHAALVLVQDSYRIAFFIYQSALGRGHPVTKAIFKKMNAV
jgi:hypothetical protein